MSDISNTKLKAFNEAISRSQAVIEFDLNGIVKDVNENFLYALGYTKEEVVGQHHRIFCESNYVLTTDYRKFWEKLSQGQYEAGEFCRISKSGHQVWIQASYNPIFNDDGKPVSIVKFATVISEQKIKTSEFESINNAIRRSQAVIEFDLNGNILNANENFLSVTGYHLSEIQGKHHRIFCDKKFVESEEYINFWNRLSKGEFESGEYRRFGKNAKEIWIQATYNPVLDSMGKPFKVIKFATNVTDIKLRSNEAESKVAALSRSQIVIEFDPEGTVLYANNNFLEGMGYLLDEVVGRHHKIFCHDDYAKSKDYEAFWRDLKNGTYHNGTFKRKKKNNEDIWIKATYNPIFDMDGRLLKVVKYAIDITKEKQMWSEFESKIQAIHRSQAVIEFSTDGVILDANENFLQIMGYSREQLVGKHHRMFCQDAYTEGAGYLAFWSKLKRGEYDQGEYLRLKSDGQEAWIMATYNPILDADGKAYKILKVASDITNEKMRTMRIEDSGKKIFNYVDELNRSVSEISSAALECELQSTKNKEQASNGLGFLKSVIDVTTNLEESARSISTISSQIQDISDRTNLLAFNATIESVRAGELGRGFSVVADEIRKLAERSAQSAKQIEGLVETTLLLSKQGKNSSGQAIAAFTEISSGVERTTSEVAVIGDSTKQQTGLASSIHSEINKISSTVEQRVKGQSLKKVS